MLLFEYPLNERARLFLRLEALFLCLRSQMTHADPCCGRNALKAFNEILAFCARPELRSDLLLELEHVASALSTWAASPEVDMGRLEVWHGQVAGQLQCLREGRGRFGQGLQYNELLNAVRGRQGVAGGVTDFDIPMLGYWLHLDAAVRKQQMDAWLTSLDPLAASITTVLGLLREATDWRAARAVQGRYGSTLNPRQPPSLIRIQIADRSDCFPQVSGGIHRFTVHFLRWLDPGQARLLESDMEFKLGLSAL